MTEKNEQEKMAAERQVELLSSALDKAVVIWVKETCQDSALQVSSSLPYSSLAVSDGLGKLPEPSSA